MNYEELVKKIEEHLNKENKNLISDSILRRIGELEINTRKLKNRIEEYDGIEEDFEERVGNLEENLEEYYKVNAEKRYNAHEKRISGIEVCQSSVEKCQRDHDRSIESLAKSVNNLEEKIHSLSKTMEIREEMYDSQYRMINHLFEGLKLIEKRVEELESKLNTEKNNNEFTVAPEPISIHNKCEGETVFGMRRPREGTIYTYQNNSEVEAYIFVNNRWYHLFFSSLSPLLFSRDKDHFMFPLMRCPDSPIEIIKRRDEIIKIIKEREKKYDNN